MSLLLMKRKPRNLAEAIEMGDAAEGDEDKKARITLKEISRLAKKGDKECQDFIDEILGDDIEEIPEGYFDEKTWEYQSLFRDAYESTLFENGNDK